MNCPICKNKLSQEMIECDMCFNCNNSIADKIIIQTEKSNNDEKIKERIEKEKQNINSIIVTTTESFIGSEIIKYNGIVSSEVFLGTGVISETITEISDMLGMYNEAFEEKIEKAKELCLIKLKTKAYKMKSNAIIGLLVNIVIMKNNMIAVNYTGTGVLIKNEYFGDLIPKKEI